MHKTLTFTPPLRQGVSASMVFVPSSPVYATFFDFFVAKFPHISSQEWRQRFDEGLVFNQAGDGLTQNTAFVADQHLYYYRHLPYEVDVPFAHQILFENDHFMVVDKPHFLTVSPTGQYVQQTLLTRLKQETGNPLLSPIHRLDRDTAGLILIAKTVDARAIYQQLFAQRQVQKTYHAIARYRQDLSFPLQFSAHLQKGEPFYTMQIGSGTHNSFTQMTILTANDTWAKYQLQPITGKQHQLRVHMNALNIPLKNDRLYPQVIHQIDTDFSEPLQLLAKEIAFFDPVLKQHYHFYSGLDLLLPPS